MEFLKDKLATKSMKVGIASLIAIVLGYMGITGKFAESVSEEAAEVIVEVIEE
jgi:hypothetical protein